MHAITIPLFEEMRLASGRSSEQLDADLKRNGLYLSAELRAVTLRAAREGG